jgi:hypothetical protein
MRKAAFVNPTNAKWRKCDFYKKFCIRQHVATVEILSELLVKKHLVGTFSYVRSSCGVLYMLFTHEQRGALTTKGVFLEL